MNKFLIDDHVLPRPVEALPEYAHGKARQALAEKISAAFGLSQASATAIANGVVDPTEVRKTIGEPTDADVEKIPVPGGMLLGIRTTVWARRIMPDPRNPRTLPSRRHPFAVEPGTGREDAKFRPVPEPRPLDPEQPCRAELAVAIENRHHLNWAAQQAAEYVLAENDWRLSIASQGVMEAVWIVTTTYQHEDGSADVIALTTAEGSSRATAVHNLLEVRSADVPYDDNEARLRAHIRRLNDMYARSAAKNDLLVALRCERVPALILVGFEPHPEGTTTFPTAIRSLVALRHVDPPKPWGDGPENEALADEVLDELYRQDLISATQRDYFAGACTRSEASAAHLPDDPVLRATQIVELFTGGDTRVGQALRVAITSQSTRKRLTPKLLNDLATALILRAVAEDRGRIDQIRRYLRHAFGQSVHRAPWQSSRRTTENLVNDALAEVRQSIAAGPTGEPGPASLELAVRAAYPLVVSGRLNADRGSTGDQPDRRTPGEVLDAMRRSFHGVHQLAQSLRDFADNTPIRAVDESGRVKRVAGNSEELTVNDIYLRTEFHPPGKTKAPPPGDTPTDRHKARVHELDVALDKLEQAFENLAGVVGDDGRPLVDARGVDHQVVARWRGLLSKMDEEMLMWGRTFQKVYGTSSSTARSGREELNDADYHASDEDDVEEAWGGVEPVTEGEVAAS